MKRTNSTDKSQGSMEYLILIATVLIVASVTVILVTGSVGERRKSILIEECRSAAAQCSLERAANPTVPCYFCEEKCVDQEGEALFGDLETDPPTSIDCCKLGMEDQIYTGAEEEREYEQECKPELETHFTYQITGEKTVDFSDRSRFDPYHPDYEITSWEWDFYDGHSSEDSDPIHTYDKVDNYHVELTVTGSREGIGIDEQTESYREWVNLAEGFRVLEVDPQDPVYPGDTLYVDILVENRGEDTDTQWIEAIMDEFPDTDGYQSTIPGGGSEDDPFALDIPSDASSGTYSVTVSTEDDSKSSDFQVIEEEPDKHTLTINVEGEGDTTPYTEGTRQLEEGTEIELFPDSDSGWYFEEWTGACSGQGTTCELTMDSDKNTTAVFEEEEDLGDIFYKSCTATGSYDCTTGASCDPTHPDVCKGLGSCVLDCPSAPPNSQRIEGPSESCSYSVNCYCGLVPTSLDQGWGSDTQRITDTDGNYQKEPLTRRIYTQDYECQGDGSCSASGRCKYECDEGYEYDEDAGECVDEEEWPECEPGETEDCENCCWDRYCSLDSCESDYLCNSGERECQDDGTWGSCDASSPSCRNECSSDSDCSDNGDECGGCDDGLICCDCDGYYMCVVDCPGGCPQ